GARRGSDRRPGAARPRGRRRRARASPGRAAAGGDDSGPTRGRSCGDCTQPAGAAYSADMRTLLALLVVTLAAGAAHAQDRLDALAAAVDRGAAPPRGETATVARMAAARARTPPAPPATPAPAPSDDIRDRMIRGGGTRH